MEWHLTPRPSAGQPRPTQGARALRGGGRPCWTAVGSSSCAASMPCRRRGWPTGPTSASPRWPGSNASRVHHVAPVPWPDSPPRSASTLLPSASPLPRRADHVQARHRDVMSPTSWYGGCATRPSKCHGPGPFFKPTCLHGLPLTSGVAGGLGGVTTVVGPGCDWRGRTPCCWKMALAAIID